ncbi:MAG: CPBP family intramembrane metalloprotease [Planctomycetota bacterium]|nr:CPBP family intramembrane metalloprotease [Planctomycetaceae bacterium]MDQ3330715.1 CPBP family intramembrane metalloprotease [Planctomycetota bacterium]
MFDHRSFIRFAGLFEASLAVIAVLIGWMAGVTPSVAIPDLKAIGVGVAATVPLIGVYYFATWIPLLPFRRIHELLVATLGRPLSKCRWHEIALLAALAGVCEELLFRGVLQPWLSRLGEPAGLIGTNLLFGVAHSVTPTYFLLASGIGFYLSGVQIVGGHLAAPILAHSLYDWFAFVQIAKAYEKRVAAGDEPPNPFEIDSGAPDDF